MAATRTGLRLRPDVPVPHYVRGSQTSVPSSAAPPEPVPVLGRSGAAPGGSRSDLIAVDRFAEQV